MNIGQVVVRVRGFLSRYLEDSDFDDETELITSGLINSLVAMQLVLYIEEEFNIAVNNDDLNIRNFNTMRNIADFIMRKTTLNTNLESFG